MTVKTDSENPKTLVVSFLQMSHIFMTLNLTKGCYDVFIENVTKTQLLTGWDFLFYVLTKRWRYCAAVGYAWAQIHNDKLLQNNNEKGFRGAQFYSYALFTRPFISVVLFISPKNVHRIYLFFRKKSKSKRFWGQTKGDAGMDKGEVKKYINFSFKNDTILF